MANVENNVRGYFDRAKKYYHNNYLVIIASGGFLVIQFLYSWLIWHRTGNLPPTPGDSYNYLVNIHHIASTGRIFTAPSQFIYGGFNFIYGLLAHLFGANPQTIYHLFFYLGKILLLGAVVYLTRSLTTDKKLSALLILALGVYSGTGEAHGFFWVVPSFWSVMAFLLLIGMAMRRVSFYPLVIVSIFFMFIHPLSIYTTVPVVLTYLVLKKLASADALKFGRLALALILAAIIQQSCLAILNHYYFGTNTASELSQVGSVLESGVVNGTDPHGEEGINQRANNKGTVTVGLLTVSDVLSKLRSTKPESTFKFQISIPKSIYRIVPGLYGVWNAYGFFLAPYPIMLAALIVLYTMFRWGLKKKDTLTVLYFVTLATAVGATIHPQGFRFLVFLWPLTYLALINYFWAIIQGKSKLRIVIWILIALYLLAQLGYGIFLTKRISTYQDYTWNKTCAVNLVNKSKTDSNMVLFYSGLALAPTAFVGEGLYSVPAVDSAEWKAYLSEPANANKDIIYLNDTADGYSADGTVAALRDKMVENAVSRGRQIKWTQCGFFEYGEEQ